MLRVLDHSEAQELALLGREFTFKRHPRRTGLAAVGDPYPWVDIKVAQKVVGHIKPPSAFSDHSDFIVWLMVVNKNEKAGWSWVTLKFRGKTERATRDFLMANAEVIQGRYNLHSMSDETS